MHIDIGLMFQYKTSRNFFILVDVFSHRIYAELLEDKTAEATIRAMDKIFKEIGMFPEICQSDKGLEFRSPKTQQYFKKHNIYWKGKSSGAKANYAEWGVFRVKKVLYAELYSKETKNWPKLLKPVVDKINDTPSPSLNYLKPSQISSPADDYLVDRYKSYKPESWKKIHQNILDYEKKGKFKIGDVVIMDDPVRNFTKSYRVRVSKH